MKTKYAFIVATCMLIAMIQGETTPLGAILAVPLVSSAVGSSKMDIIFLLDSSGSVSKSDYRKMKAFVKETVMAVDIESGSVRVGLAVFGTDDKTVFHLNRYTTKHDIIQALTLAPYLGGGTNTGDAIKTLREEMFTAGNGDRVDAPNSAIIITDGQSNYRDQTIQEAEKTRESGTHVYAIGIGLSSRSEVEAMGTPPASSNSFIFGSFDELEDFGPRFATSVATITKSKSDTSSRLEEVPLDLNKDQKAVHKAVTTNHAHLGLEFNDDNTENVTEDTNSGSGDRGNTFYYCRRHILFNLV